MIRSFAAATLAVFIASAAWSDDVPQSSPAPADAKSSIAAPVTPLPKPPAKPLVYKPKESDIVTGHTDAPVTIVEYASLSCPHCSHFYVHALPEITTKYIDTGKAKLVFRSYPLNDPALKAAELVECAAPDRREAFVKVLFNTQLKWAYDASYRDALGNIAVIGGIDRLKFESCMNDKSIEKKVLTVAKEASEEYKVNSTPSFYVNGVPFTGDHDAPSLGKAIDVALANPGKK